MNSAVIGLGETGQPLLNLLNKAYGNVVGIDEKIAPMSALKRQKFDIINICIPYSEKFIDIVESYQELYQPDLVIIHSTVPIGTTAKIKNAVHSPILGVHRKMKRDMENYIKWIGGERANDALDYLGKLFTCNKVLKSEWTEALKLMCLAKYGMSIAFAQYQKEVGDALSMDYELVRLWDKGYNSYVASDLKRPILTPPGEKIGGHCVTQNTKLLNEQFPNQILDEILKYA